MVSFFLHWWKQVRQVSQSTSMFHTAQSTRSFPICPAALRRTAASWRDRRESAPCCGRSWNAGCCVARFSTRLSTELQLRNMLTGVCLCKHSSVWTEPTHHLIAAPSRGILVSLVCLLVFEVLKNVFSSVMGFILGYLTTKGLKTQLIL